MKPLPAWSDFFRRPAAFKTLHVCCLTCCRPWRNLPGTMLLLLLTAFLPLYAQPAIQWDKTLGGSGGDGLQSLQQTRDGGYILGGSSGSGIGGDKTQASKGGSDYWVVRLDAAGNKQWDKTIGGNGNDDLDDLQQTRDGGFILGGRSYSGVSGDKTEPGKGECSTDRGCLPDFWVVKLDAAGTRQWDKTIGGNGFDDHLTSVEQTLDGGYILGGSSDSDISGDKSEGSRGYTDYWVVKLDATGNKVWDKTIGGNSFDYLYSLQQTRDGGYILGGTTLSGISSEKTEAGRGGSDFWVVKLDASGNKVWDKTLGGSGEDGYMFLPQQFIQQTHDDGYILGGYSNSGISGEKTEANRGGCCAPDYWVIKLDAAGNKVWDKTIGGSSFDVLQSLEQTTDRGYILGGYSASGSNGEKTQASQQVDYWVVKLDETGNKVWDKTIGGSGYDNLNALQQTADEGYILGGGSNSPTSGDKTEANKGEQDYWVIKLAPYPEGEQVKSLTLINTESEQPIRPLTESDTLLLGELPKKLNIRADTSPDTVGSVVFALSGQQTRLYVDNKVPYALFGDVRGDYEKWYPAPGSYTLTATPYAQPDGQGTEGTPLTIHFTVKLPQVESFTLINTESEQPIRALQDRDTLLLAELPRKLNIRADTKPNTVGSVQFALSGKQDRTYLDNAAPYALFGDARGDYNKWYPAPGDYTLTATPYTERDAKGDTGIPLTIRVTMVRQPAVAAARQVKAPAAARAELAPRPILYPNPTTNGHLQVQLPAELQGRVSYTLQSAVGRKLAGGTLTQAGNLLELDFSRQLRATGWYYLKIEGANGQQTFRIMRR